MWKWFSRAKTNEPATEMEAAPARQAEATPTAQLLNLQPAAGRPSVPQQDSLPLERTTTTTQPGGEPLPSAVQSRLESQFGADLTAVRIHTDEEAAHTAIAQGARAYTVNRDIYFAPGQYDPRSPQGQHLLAHELAHVLQQTQPETHTALDPETEAERAADTVAAGLPLDFALRAAPANTVAAAPANWAQDVNQAKADNDADKMAALMETALIALKRKVVVAKTTAGGNVAVQDYQPLPSLNFDLHLNSKRSKPLGAGATTHKLTSNLGYSFTDSGQSYVLLGPLALNTDSPIFTRMHAEHELFHTTQHFSTATKPGAGATATTAAPSRDDQGLEAYTQDFLHYFHELYSFRPAWLPLLQFYETASATAQTKALTALQNYYQTPPSPPIATDEVPKIKKAMAAWLRRRQQDAATATRKLIQDLTKALNITANNSPTSTPSATPAPSPKP